MQDQRLEWLRPKMDKLFAFKAHVEAGGREFNVLKSRECRNPRICEKLIESEKINQYGSNLPREHFDPDAWKRKPDAFYDSSAYRRLVSKREREKLASRS